MFAFEGRHSSEMAAPSSLPLASIQTRYPEWEERGGNRSGLLRVSLQQSWPLQKPSR